MDYLVGFDQSGELLMLYFSTCSWGEEDIQTLDIGVGVLHNGASVLGGEVVKRFGVFIYLDVFTGRDMETFVIILGQYP